MKRSLALIVAVASLLVADVASAQSPTFREPFEWELGKGPWGIFLPGYALGTDADGNDAFQDDLDDPGFYVQLQAVRRFLHTRTSAEFRGFYGAAGANSTADRTGSSYLDPSSGANVNLGNGRTHLSSDVDHYGFDLALRDTWPFRIGGLSAGMAFSYFAFDQDFDVEFNSARLFNERLESDFLGGKGFVGWDGFLFGRASSIDLGYGYFDVDARYEYDGAAGDFSMEAGDQTGVVEFSATTRETFNIGLVGLTIGATYIEDMPQIIRDGGTTAIGNDSAATLTAMVEWIF